MPRTSFFRFTAPAMSVACVVLVTSFPASAQQLASAAPAAPPEAPVAAPAAPALHEWFGSRPWREWGTVTGDWNTLRSWLTDRGVAVAVAETADISSVGAPQDGRAVVGRGLFDSSLTVDAALLHVPGASMLVQLQWLSGRNGSAALGDAQGFSNIDADGVPAFGEAWYEQRFGDRVRAKVGRVDANSEFAYVDAASDFLSAAMGFSPSIVAMPTYPTPASSISLFVQPVSAFDVAAGVFNGNPDDARWSGWDSRFDIVQAGAHWAVAGGGLGGKVTAGAWRLRDFSDAAAGVRGAYFTVEQALWTEQERGAAAFLQVGVSDRASDVDRHVGGGLRMRGISRRRAMDVTGLGATWVRLTGDVRQSELALEAFHRIVVTPSISFIPDVQVIDRPAGDAARGRTVAVTSRLQFDF